MAPLFQIGEDKYSHKYSRTAMACNGYPIYNVAAASAVAPVQLAPPTTFLHGPRQLGRTSVCHGLH